MVAKVSWYATDRDTERRYSVWVVHSAEKNINCLEDDIYDK